MNYESMDKEALLKLLLEKDEQLQKICLENQKLRYYADIDAMTGVFNRRSGLELLSKELYYSNDNIKNIVVCYIDMDKLKNINDTFGHEEGDKLLIDATNIFKNNIRKSDFIVRMGGDEFLIVFPNTTLREAHNIFNRIDKSVNEKNLCNKRYNLRFSCGFYEHKEKSKQDITISDLIRKADAEMYKNKKEFL